MPKFRKKPVVIEAMKYLGEDNYREATAFIGRPVEKMYAPFILSIPTLEGWINASPGDYIIQGVQGEFYPCKPDIFAATYEPVE